MTQADPHLHLTFLGQPTTHNNLNKPSLKPGWEGGGGKGFPNHCVGFFCSKAKSSGQDIDHLDFKIVVEPKDSSSFTVILVASSRQEKAAWTSDISQVGPSREGVWSSRHEELPRGPCWAVASVWARR